MNLPPWQYTDRQNVTHVCEIIREADTPGFVVVKSDRTPRPLVIHASLFIPLPVLPAATPLVLISPHQSR